MDGGGPEDAFSVFDLVDGRPGPEVSYEQNRLYADFVRSIEKLPRQLRIVAEHRLLGERSIDETKISLGLSEAAVKSRLFRARSQLAAAHSIHKPRELPVEGAV